MRVSMKIVSARALIGYFRSQDVYEILLDVQLTEEEKYLIKKLGTKKDIIFTISHLAADKQSQQFAASRGEDGKEFYIYYFVEGKWPRLVFDRLAEAQQAIPKIEEQFRILKEILNNVNPQASRSFEL